MEGHIQLAVRNFAIEGTFIDAKLHKNGHINSTYLSVWDTPAGRRNYIHQQINHIIFPDVDGLMRNIALVTDHLRSRMAGSKTGECTLDIIPTLDGKLYYQDMEGNYWRTYSFIPDSESYDQAQNLNHAYEAAKAFGRFVACLADMDPGLLTETIPHFHDTPRRIATLKEVIEADPWNRVQSVKNEIAFVLEREEVAGILMKNIASGVLPLRVTHNDMKLNNLLFDRKTGHPVCVVDLDTCMPGSSLFDFGDLVRITSVPSAEDEQDLSKVRFDFPIYCELVRGYLESYGGVMSKGEIELLPYGPLVITLTIGIRFLSDYIAGDKYFRIHRPSHNIDRARTQFKVVSDMERMFPEMQAIVKGFLK